MKQVIVVCITDLLSVVLLMAPSYYKIMTPPPASPQADRYLVLDGSDDRIGSLVLNQNTGKIYFVKYDGVSLIGKVD